MISGFLDESIVKRAQEKGLVTIEIVNLRDFAKDNYKTVDDKPYGGGAGMVLKVEPLVEAIENSKLKIKNSKLKQKTILTTPRGQVYNQSKAQAYSKLENLIIIAGHYEGVDERMLDYIDEEVSIGDFVMTGGEIAAVTIVDSVVRLIPHVLKKDEATAIETFLTISIDELTRAVGVHPKLEEIKRNGIEMVQLLEYPQYTRPDDFEGKKVPEILLSGDHAEIQKWQLKMAFEETFRRRPDLLGIT